MKQKTIQAFTLIEVIIAIAIFSIGVLTVLNLLVNNLYFLDKASTKTQASFLAKEGIELVYNLRDSNKLKAYPRNCLPLDEINIDKQNNMVKICKNSLWEKMEGWEDWAFSINFSPEEYMTVSEIQALDSNWDKNFEKYKLVKILDTQKKYHYYTTASDNTVWKDTQSFAKFARYIIAKPLVEGEEEISTKNIVKLESHVLYKNGTKRGEVVFESFIWNY